MRQTIRTVRTASWCKQSLTTCGDIRRERSDITKAREMIARMGFASVENAMSMVGNGTNFDIAPRDFKVAESIWGRDLYSMKGKTTRMTSPVADITVGPTVVQQQQVMCIDIMFIEQLPFLVADVSPLGLTLVKSLSTVDKRRLGRTAEAVGAGIKYFLGVLNTQRFVVRVIMSDGEGAVSKLQQELNHMGVEVDISGAGGHVPRVERRIRVIKERVRATMHSLPYTLSTLGVIMCVLYCVSRLNYEPSGIRQSGISPREAFLGRKIDGKRDFRCAYGDYAQCTVPMTNNSMVARTDDCVVMMPTGNRTGSVKVLSLSTGRIVNRDQLRVLPMPESLIAQLNALAKQDGRLSVKKGGHRY